MEKITLIWLIICSMIASLSHGLNSQDPIEYHGLCVNMFLNHIEKLKKLENCTIVVGDLKISLLERTKPEDFRNLTFPKLKEVTGYMVVYRVAGLETLSNLLPNLARIRGNTLLYNYALIIYDIAHLREIGLNSLLKIDRGGVIIWGGPLTCFVNTIDWNAIAPRSRHVLSKPDKHAQCNFPCTCTSNPATNRCWSNKKCQIFLEGPDSWNCSRECIGCRNTNPKSCTLCRDYTYKEECVSRCPNNTLLLSVSNHCVTIDECIHLNRWEWNNTCVSECPKNFVQWNEAGNTKCVPCDNCHQTCGNMSIQTLDTIQLAEKCVYINGSLSIHIWSIPNAANELRYFLKNIVEVTDYIEIYGSITLTSLDFLSSLQRIKGRRLFNGKYSLVIYDMHNLQSLFLPHIIKGLNVERGTVRFYRNPMLCMRQIKKLTQRFPVAPNELDIPQGMNGYSGSCNEMFLKLTIQVKNETFAIASFFTKLKGVHYTVLYVRIPHGTNDSIVPETCSDSEWFAISVPDTFNDFVHVPLPSLRPASTYAVCVEKYDPSSRHLARSSIVKFETHVGKPEPPFILELVASSSNVIVIRWVDHMDYRPFITRYELDINLVDINNYNIITRDHCTVNDDEMFDIDFSRHAKVMRPPKNYERGCESMCGILSSVTMGAMVEDYFDVCDTIGECDDDSERSKNSSINGNIVSLSLDISGPRNNFQVGGLAPFRDYKFRLRACTKDLCSRTAKDVVQTLHSENADIASIIHKSVIDPGLIYVKWEPPSVTNGPLLAYTIEIYPNVKVSDMNHLVPQTWCVPGNETSLTVKSNKASKYLVRICSTTLAHPYACNEWIKIEGFVKYELVWWWSGVLFGLFLYVFSWVIGWRWKRRIRRSDSIPLFDITSSYRQESEPPAAMLSDFVSLHNISLCDLRDLS
ncbi:putative molluscan insulin-related peptide(s) receptor [Vanessa cardui]|uniref:putative molluscan insulin-related peptide(s) receptor n=1 Tax=Vanessa cardui TaxID=171605 RepID=UPI001F13CAE3|nr:putative molluscan insulin-related peptide(s) receptor [Vanessa cardui]